MGRIIIKSGIEAIKAEYKEQVIPDYTGNPFIEALPPIYSTGEVIERISIYPPFSDKERLLEKQYKIHLVQRLFQCFQPLTIHLDLESRLSRIIRQGYLARNSFDPKYRHNFINSNSVINNMNHDLNHNELFRSTGASLTIIGISGIGKTTAINRILSLYPQVIIHSKYKDKNFSMYQITWLKIDCPHDGSLKGLCVEFFLKIDSILGTNYYQKFGQGRLSVNTMLPAMAKIAINIGLGLLIIDEVQNLNEARSGGADKMLNFFVGLTNLGIPNVLVGTPSAMSILQSKFRQARRGSGQGDLVWDRLKNDENWDLLMNAIWDYQWNRNVTILDKKISDTLYEESQGITDIAVKLYAMSQIRSMMSGTEVITSELIQSVAKENFKLVKPMIDALKTSDIKKIALYEDIATDMTDFMGLISGSNNYVTEMKIAAIREHKRDNKSENALINNDAILNKIENKKTAVKKVNNYGQDDIRYVVANARKELKSAYDTLSDIGIIIKYEDDLFLNEDAL